MKDHGTQGYMNANKKRGEYYHETQYRNTSRKIQRHSKTML